MATDTEFRVGSMAFRLCLHLSKRERGAAMFSDEIGALYKIESNQVGARLASAVEQGWLTRHRSPAGMFYSAGPLLEAI